MTTPLTDPDNVHIVWDDPATVSSADASAYALILGQSGALKADASTPDGDDDSDSDVVAENTGAMIALVPSAADIERLALPGGEDPQDLHLTLLYLGDAAQYGSAARQAIVTNLTDVVLGQPALVVTGFGVAMWNPQGAEPAIVLNVGGEGLQAAQYTAESAMYGASWDSCVPEQHTPWSPHVCLAYSADAGLIAQALERVGPVTFDRVRVAFAGSNVDIPLIMGDPVMMSGETVMLSGPSGVGYADGASGTADPAPGGVGGVGNTNLPGTAPNMYASGGAPWEGVLVLEGVPTGDGRMFGLGSLEFAPTPQPFSWAKENLGEHMGSVIVGRIDQIWRDPANSAVIRGRGVFNTASTEGTEAFRQVDGGFAKWVSVDVDSVSDSEVELIFPEGTDPNDMFAQPETVMFNKGRIRGATLVAISAFEEAQIHMVTNPLPDDMTPIPTDAPAASGDQGNELVSDGEWLAGRHMARLAAHVPWAVAQSAFAWADGNKIQAGSVARLACRLLHHEIGTDGSVGPANLTACASGIGALLTNTGLAMSLSDRRAAYDHLAAHLRAGGLTPQSFSQDGLGDEVQALYASATEAPAPPDSAFADPGFDGPTPITITASADGEWNLIKGHGATWDACHIAFPGACTAAPREGFHDFYRLGEVVTASGARVPVGTITMATGHAPTTGIDPRRVTEHYDNTGSMVAIVASGEDEHGIWLAGVVKPGVPAARLMELRAAKLSGDWRRIGGMFRLVAMLAVNVPGFPVPRIRVGMANGAQVSLVAAGIVPDYAQMRALANREAMRTMAAALKQGIGRDPVSMAKKLRDEVHGGR